MHLINFKGFSSQDRSAVYFIRIYYLNEFYQLFPSNNYAYPTKIIKTDDGYLISAIKFYYDKRQDATLIKLDENLEMIWEKSYGGHHRDQAFSVIETSDEGYLISGRSRSYLEGDIGAYFFVKTNINGDTLWQRTYGDKNEKDYLFDVKQDNNGDFYAIGNQNGFENYSTFDFSQGLATPTIFKLSSTGDSLWQKFYPSTQNEFYNQIEISPINGFYILGSTQENTLGSFDILLSKFDWNGNLEWKKTFGDTLFDYGSTMFISDDNHIYIAGSTCRDTANYTTDVQIIKTDLNGNIIWSRVYAEAYSDYPVKIIPTEDGNISILINKTFKTSHKNGISIIKMDVNGNNIVPSYNSKETTFRIFPNPSTNGINIKLSDQITCGNIDIQIFSLQGKLITTQNIKYNEVNYVSTRSWSSGVYVYRATSTCGTNTYGKFIVR